MFQRILLPLDGSVLAECVLPHAAALARAYDSELFLLRVQDSSAAITRPRPVDPLDWQIRKAEAETYLQEIAGRLKNLGLNVQYDLLEGRAAESIITYAHNQDSDLILMSSHGQSGLSPWNVSSVVQQVILRAKRSVMIVRAYEPVVEDMASFCYRRILLALDGSQRAESVLPTAESLARANESQIVIAHVVRRPEIIRRTPPSQEELDLAAQLTERNREEMSRYLTELQARLDVRVETRILVSDKLTGTLHTLVEDEDVDLVILSAHGYSGESRFPFGGVVISFIDYGITPLLIIQDLSENYIEPTRAEEVVREYGGLKAVQGERFG
jgi:nucleotide-binding universal stress UspA family protein